MGNPQLTPVVVGIGHGVFDDMTVVARYANRKPDDKSPLGLADIGSALNTLRFHDFALPAGAAHRAPAWTGLTPDNVGGLDGFLKVVETEIKPKVAALVPVDAAKSAIFGHSIGGPAVLRAWFTDPAAFQTFIAASAAIWWDADAVLADEPSFSKRVESIETSPRILITAGSAEPDSPAPPQALLDSLPLERRSELTAYLKMAGRWNGMVSGGRSLVARLGQLHGGPAQSNFCRLHG